MMNIDDCEKINITHHNDDEECNSISVLLVDDDRLSQYFAREALESTGYEVITAQCGDEAIRIMAEKNIDVVMLDVNMPGQNGYAVCREIRRVISDPFLPVIFVTCMNDMDSIESAYQAGGTDFATKPVNWAIMSNRIRHLVRTRALSNELKLSESSRHELIEAIPDTIMRIDRDGKVLDFKPGIHSAGPIASAFSSVSRNGGLPRELATGILENLPRVFGGSGSQQFEFDLWNGMDRIRYEVRMFASGGGEAVAMVRDITERHRNDEHMRYLAFHDEVTGLPNLAYVHKQLGGIFEHYRGSGHVVGIVRLEIVGFEHVNSVLGNNSGDALLRLWAERLRDTAARLGDAQSDLLTLIVGRVNGPGFVAVLGGVTDDQGLRRYVDQLERKMAEIFLIGEYEMNVVSRIGASMGRADDVDGYGLMKQAELALAEARKSSKTGLNLYNADTHARTLGHVSMAHDLRRAIANGDLYLEYQPKISAQNGDLVGVEALVRWDHYEHGLVMPDSFIPLAEESDLILSLGEFVIYEACHQSRNWRDAGYDPVPIAVNLSGHQFNQRGLVEGVRNAMALYMVERGDLEVELTETVAIENSTQVKKILNEFHEQGIRTAIDDFGTGYSSLSSLRRFLFNTLKIDRSFVRHVNDNRNAAAITEAIINMGHVLGLQIVAEGVETVRQYNFLRDKGCDVIQGYFTGRPMNAAALQQQFLSV